MPYMYMLSCADGTTYVGSTIDLERRLAQHQAGEGAEYTRARRPVRLIHVEEYARIDDAFAREKQVQNWSRAKRLALARGDDAMLSAASRKRRE
jgi:putative endonuclease